MGVVKPLGFPLTNPWRGDETGNGEVEVIESLVVGSNLCRLPGPVPTRDTWSSRTTLQWWVSLKRKEKSKVDFV